MSTEESSRHGIQPKKTVSGVGGKAGGLPNTTGAYITQSQAPNAGFSLMGFSLALI